MKHNNLRGWPGDTYSLYDNLWILQGGPTTLYASFTPPTSGWYHLTGCGAGAGAGGSSTGGSGTYGASSGGGGATIFRQPVWLDRGIAINIAVGAAGVGGAAGANDGTAGGDTVFGSLLTLGGGGKGLKSAASAPLGGAAGLITGTLANSKLYVGTTPSTSAYPILNAYPGGDGIVSSSTNGPGGGPGFSAYTNPMDFILIGANGTPGAGVISANGNDGSGYGVGGSGGSHGNVNKSGGNGTPGLLIIEMII